MFTVDRQRQPNYSGLPENNSREPIPVCRCVEKVERTAPRIQQPDRILKWRRAMKIPNLQTTTPMCSTALSCSCRDPPPRIEILITFCAVRAGRGALHSLDSSKIRISLENPNFPQAVGGDPSARRRVPSPGADRRSRGHPTADTRSAMQRIMLTHGGDAALGRKRPFKALQGPGRLTVSESVWQR